MKTQIRKNTFETNSSSTHAICISKEGYNKRDYIEFHVGDFGWKFEEYNDMYHRASYLITAIFSFDKDYADKKLQQLKTILDENNIDYLFPEPSVSSWDYAGEKRFYYDISGYIDHVGETREFVEDVLTDSDKLFRYLFGDSLIITGNDNNDSYSDRMYMNEGEEVTKWGTYTKYGDLKPEFENYEIYRKGN